MTAQQLLKRVQVEADARFGETIERLLLLLRQQHTHQCWKKECWCDYCQFIRGRYVDAKLGLHKIKKRLRHFEYLSYGDPYYRDWSETLQHMTLEKLEINQKQVVRELKQHKKDLQKDII